MPAYADTSAWIAIHEPRDANHQAARRRLRELLASQTTLWTGWHTLIEFADGLARHYDQRHASQTLQRIIASPVVKVVASEPHLDAAIEILSRRHNWQVDLSDCLSFALMNANGITRAFTYDADFRKAGFEMES